MTAFIANWCAICKTEGTKDYMQQHYRHLDLQTLIDLLARETESYTRALSSGKQAAIEIHKETIDALVAEIIHRKKVQDMPPTRGFTSYAQRFP